MIFGLVLISLAMFYLIIETSSFSTVSAYLEDLNRNYSLMETSLPQRENLRGNWSGMTEPRKDDRNILS